MDTCKIVEDFTLESSKCALRAAFELERCYAENNGEPALSPVFSAHILARLFGNMPRLPRVSDISLLGSDFKTRAAYTHRELVRDVPFFSIARFGQEYNQQRLDDSFRRIDRIFRNLYVVKPILPGDAHHTNFYDDIFISRRHHDIVRHNGAPLLDDAMYSIHASVSAGGGAVLDFTRYRLCESGSQAPPPYRPATTTDLISSVESGINGLFGNKGGDGQHTNGLINTVLQKVLPKTQAWANDFTEKLKYASNIAEGGGGGFLGHNIYQEKSVMETHMTDTKMALAKTLHLIRRSSGRTVTQLSTVEELNSFRENIDCCRNTLIMGTKERIVSTLLFYVSFKPSSGSELNYIRKKVGTLTESGRIDDYNEPIIEIERRTLYETLFGLCYFFKVLPPVYTDFLFSLESLSKTKLYDNRLVTHLSNSCDQNFDALWDRYIDFLQKRIEFLKKLRDTDKKIDGVDVCNNLMGPTHTLVSDVALALENIKYSLNNFLVDLREKYNLWQSYITSTTTVITPNF